MHPKDWMRLMNCLAIAVLVFLTIIAAGELLARTVRLLS